MSDSVHTARTTVGIKVLDENEHEPTFDKPFYQVSLPEMTPPGTSIVQVGATDMDGSDNNNRISYHLLQAHNNKYDFWIDSNSGAVYNNRTITADSNQERLIQLGVEAMDNGAPQKSSVTTIQVQIVQKASEIQPRFDRQYYRYYTSW